MGKGAKHRRGVGMMSKQEEQIGQAFYSLEGSIADDQRISGVAITRAEFAATAEDKLLLEDKEGNLLKLSSIEAIAPSGKNIGLYRFTANSL